ncbi:MAG TPA: MMPL family transporter [Marmoricola sp.]|nr:MMPL family transporter [Marmoricola sp.]
MHRQIAGKLTSPVTKWIVLGFWIAALLVSMPFAQKLTDVQDNQAQSWLPGSAESTKALEKLNAFQDQNDIPTSVVYKRASGLTPADFQAITSQTAQILELKGAKSVGPGGAQVPPEALIQKSGDGQVAVSTVTFNFGKNGWNDLPDTADQIHKIAQIDGVTVHLAGPGGQAADSAEAFKGLDGTLILWTALVVIVILLLTYRSPILWLLPIISSGIALMTAQAVIYFLAKNAGLTVNGQSQAILTILVIGAGTDYALLLIARYREELRRHEDRHEAMAFALHRAAPAIVASASTVVVGMLCLTLAEMNSTAGLGPVCAIGIAVGLLAMITLLPALLVIGGRWLFWPKRPQFGSHEPTTTGLWAKVGQQIKPRPRAVWVVTALLLAIAGLGVTTLNAHGLTNEDSYTKKFDSVKGQEILTAHKLANNSTPVMVVADAAKGDEVRQAMIGLKGIAEPSPVVTKDGVAYISAPMTVDSTTQAAFRAVDKVRAAVHAVPGAHALVSGNAAIFDDIEKASTRDNKVIIPVVLLMVMLILMVLLRAVLSPFLLILTVILSFGAALGLGSLVFKYVFDFAGADASFPLFVFVFLVALGIDYNIFLMTRVREETLTRGTREGSLVALSSTGGVITSAGLVLASTFAVLATLPLVFLVEMAFTVALGVLLDTMIVRSVLVTALNLDLGGRIWWPSRIDSGSAPTAPPAPEPELANV